MDRSINAWIGVRPSVYRVDAVARWLMIVSSMADSGMPRICGRTQLIMQVCPSLAPILNVLVARLQYIHVRNSTVKHIHGCNDVN